MITNATSGFFLVQVPLSDRAVIRASEKNSLINNHTGDRVSVTLHLLFHLAGLDRVDLDVCAVAADKNIAFIVLFPAFDDKNFVSFHFLEAICHLHTVRQLQVIILLLGNFLVVDDSA